MKLLTLRTSVWPINNNVRTGACPHLDGRIQGVFKVRRNLFEQVVLIPSIFFS